MQKEEFIKQYHSPARKAGECFGINPVVILAQSAIETGWGESTLAKEHNNFFGITAFGRPNAFWKGPKTDLSENGGIPSLWFRKYETPEDSFMDYARLIHTAYPVAASVSHSPSAFAKEIAYSKYISEVNGDNRAAYRRMLVSISGFVEKLLLSQSLFNH
ncbi:glucosaminidase domain-containing protein [uncultured Parabacteroides sp.]|jgi:flagellar protein FlgJ|uniref:glycoside hydrolase family 73 protein n=1 Tax=uncultured Parabacteroides sp. TaxID=512312 RepID=UPI0025E3A117|nr:glucosaminidase domain-containing protein [uncultured Parabacteroides sp.]